VWCGFNLVLGHVKHLLELKHEIPPGMETTGGIDEQEIRVPIPGRFHGVVHDSRGISTFLVCNSFDSQSLPPPLELVDGRGAERVPRREKNLVVGIQEMSQLRHRGRFTTSVHTDEEINRRFIPSLHEGSSAGTVKHFRHGFANIPLSRIYVRILTQRIQEPIHGVHTDVTAEKGCFEVVNFVRTDAAPGPDFLHTLPERIKSSGKFFGFVLGRPYGFNRFLLVRVTKFDHGTLHSSIVINSRFFGLSIQLNCFLSESL